MTGTHSSTPPRLQARLRGHRVEAARLALSLGRLEGLTQVQESGRAGREAGGGRGLGQVMAKREHGLADQVLKRLQPSALFGEAFIRLGGYLHPR